MTRENLIVFEQSSGDQYRFGMTGAELSDEEAEECLRQIKDLDPVPEYLVLSGSLPPGIDNDFYDRIARNTSDDKRVILDTSGKPLAAVMTDGTELCQKDDAWKLYEQIKSVNY